jgi:hypothetical protein
MVTAKLKIVTCYGEAIIPVEVVRKGPRPGTAWVSALNGLEPFTMTSHGGPVQVRQALIPTPSLCEVYIEASQVGENAGEGNSPEPQFKIPKPVSELDFEAGDTNNIPVDAFLESAYEDRTWIE